MPLALHRELGLTDDEAAAITGLLGRPANDLELAMYAVMWSEHFADGLELVVGEPQ